MSAGPFVVNATFALELYRKTLNRLYGNDVGRTHDLLQLFSALPAEAKQAVRREFSNAQPRPATVASQTSMRFRRKSGGCATPSWNGGICTNASGEVRFPELIFVLNALHNTCRADAKLNASNPAVATGTEPSSGQVNSVT
jgi:hypothetical protein